MENFGGYSRDLLFDNLINSYLLFQDYCVTAQNWKPLILIFPFPEIYKMRELN